MAARPSSQAALTESTSQNVAEIGEVMGDLVDEPLEHEAGAEAPPAALLARPLVLVGLMGAGKSSIGRRLAHRFGVAFADADTEIEKAAGRTIPEIFEAFGEEEFRNGERRVIRRLIESGGPRVLATGGGAFMADDTRALIKAEATSLWLKADFETLFERVSKRSNRPLLKTADPKATLRDLMQKRYPIYGEADLVVETQRVPIEETVDKVYHAVLDHLAREATPYP
ncbi:shikimate kinase [Thalassobaculum sp. OXR-137]|uniref:shikimate kinase n=1 Tax=Thalassobaculum sp. OXR-137 TaxID=3100173 RepID=UPI002AC8C30C|nr:shikimate kinase [Thalassobaculum sp. OXR-137]WPZ34798.1 shikimate kinase [Thalassobaculum sp. OXR-137]